MTTRLAIALALTLLAGGGLWACGSVASGAAVEASGSFAVTLVD